jgi:hypothetical protein
VGQKNKKKYKVKFNNYLYKYKIIYIPYLKERKKTPLGVFQRKKNLFPLSSFSMPARGKGVNEWLLS